MTKNKLKVGMIGVGGFGSRRRELMRKTGLFDLVAVYDMSRDSMLLAESEDNARSMDSYESLLAIPELDAMIVSTGARFHAEHIIAAIQRGLHVFVEKPLASTIDDVRAIITAQRKAGVVVGCGHKDHSADVFSITVKQMIENGELGKMVTFDATTSHSGGFFIKPGDWRGSKEHNPGGMLFQCGVHKLHELIYYLGPIKRVQAAMRYDLHETDTADTAFCHLEFACGVIGTLNAYHITPSIQSLMITGTKAAVFKDDRPWDGENGQWIQRIPQPMDGSIEKREPLMLLSENHAGGSLRSFYNAIIEGGTPYPSALDGARALAPVFAAAESAEKGGWVEVEAF